MYLCLDLLLAFLLLLLFYLLNIRFLAAGKNRLWLLMLGDDYGLPRYRPFDMISEVLSELPYGHIDNADRHGYLPRTSTAFLLSFEENISTLLQVLHPQVVP